jgi:cystathionine beta-lyase/cystathionine gamma-synthase
MPDELNNDKYSKETRVMYGKGHTTKWDYNHHIVPPMSSSITYRLDSAERGARGFIEFANLQEQHKDETPIWIYDRLGEPNKDILEENLAFAEGGDVAITFATGMAAISAAFGSFTQTGDEIIAHHVMYGCTYSLLKNWYPRYNINVKMLDLTNHEVLREAISPNTRIVYFETPINPTMELIDIQAVARIVEEFNKDRDDTHSIKIIIDNTFATPFCQRPLEHGAHVVVHSLTKGIGGFGTDMGGAIITAEKYRDLILLYRKDFGGVLSAKSAWPVIVYGLPTLAVRVRREMDSAMKVASWLEKHPLIESVSYPGLPSFPQREIAQRQMRDFEGNFAPGSLMYFVVKGKTPQEARDFGESLINDIARNSYVMTLAVSLGQNKTLIEHPGSMTHSAIPADEQASYGMNPGGIRLSIGLENPDDIISDLETALSKF